MSERRKEQVPWKRPRSEDLRSGARAYTERRALDRAEAELDLARRKAVKLELERYLHGR